jgi:hypothetical protein
MIQHSLPLSPNKTNSAGQAYSCSASYQRTGARVKTNLDRRRRRIQVIDDDSQTDSSGSGSSTTVCSYVVGPIHDIHGMLSGTSVCLSPPSRRRNQESYYLEQFFVSEKKPPTDIVRTVTRNATSTACMHANFLEGRDERV